MKAKMIVYNNHTGIVNLMNPLFESEGIQVIVARDYTHLVNLLKQDEAQLLLLDVVIGSKSIDTGVECLESIRGFSNMPMIVVSDKKDDKSKVKVLNAGADDYCTTECSPLELLARIKSQLRRYLMLRNLCENLEHIYRVDDLEINDSTRKVTVEGKEVKLTPIEYNILKLLVMERGKVLSVDAIYESIWKMTPIGADNTIAVHIRHIREKIEDNPKQPKYLKVVWGTGYKVG